MIDIVLVAIFKYIMRNLIYFSDHNLLDYRFYEMSQLIPEISLVIHLFDGISLGKIIKPD